MRGVRYLLGLLMVAACEKSGPVSSSPSESSQPDPPPVGPTMLGVRPTTVPAREPPPANDPNSLVVEVAANNQVVVGGKLLLRDQLEGLFRAAFARDHDTQVIIRAEAGVTHGTVVGIMETAKLAGLKRLAIGTGSLTLPSSAAARMTTTLFVDITANGKLFVGGTASTIDEVDRAFREASARDPDTRVIIRADKSAAYKAVVEIVDHAKAGGLAHVALATTP